MLANVKQKACSAVEEIELIILLSLVIDKTSMPFSLANFLSIWFVPVDAVHIIFKFFAFLKTLPKRLSTCSDL